MTSWHTTFGKVGVVEVVLEEQGKTVRPFLQRSGISPRCCSIPLQKRIVDFASETSFHGVVKQLKMHYGFELSPEVIRKTALTHANHIEDFVEEAKDIPEKNGVEQLLCEADGGMVPIVRIESGVDTIDRRRTRKVLWKEARLCFSRDIKKIQGYFRATLQCTEALGERWFSSAVEAGLGRRTRIHCVGDGAKWIQEEAARVFGGQGKYLVDFYHVSEYLAAAAKGDHDPKGWLELQQKRLKSGDLYLVLQALETMVFSENGSGKEGAVACYRYVTNRLDQLDYLGAIEEGLPIGSGEIESGHRHVVQKRMKRAGSWWKEENAESMLQLLTLRSNDLWDKYWATQQCNGVNEAA